MTRHLGTIFILTTLLSCSDKQADKTSDVVIEHYESGPTKVEKQFSDGDEKLSFKTIADVIKDKKSYAWVNLNPLDSSSSLSLHFNLDMTDTLAVAYSAECWLYFPYKANEREITVYWANIIDTKYDFDIVKAMTKISDKYSGQPFMTLKLTNDSTLIASYPLTEVRKKINSAAKERTFFPDKYTVCKTCF